MTAPAFLITIGRKLPGARLSMLGHWGNIPFETPEAAEEEARRIGGPGAVITRGRGR